jgi:hypothetical protein
MRRLLLALLCAVALLGAAACSSDDGDDGGSADTGSATDDSVADGDEGDEGDDDADASGASEDFCAAAADLTSVLEGDDTQLPDEEAIAALQDLADSAPEEIQGDIQTVTDAYDELRQLDPEDADNFEAVLDLLFDPEFIGAVEQVGVYLEAECSVDIETPSEDGLSGDDDDAPDEGEVDSAALRTFFEAEDAALEARIQTIASVAGLELSIGVRNLDDPAEAVEICDALSAYVYDEVGATSTTIKVSDTSGTLLASREDEAGSCEAA